MAEIKDKHPSWFKMKIERRKLIKDLPTDTAVNVLLACWDYLETMEIPGNLSPMERIAFSAFFPDMEEAWARYEQRITAKQKIKSTDTVRSRPTPNETEEEPETEEDTKRVYKAALFLPQWSKSVHTVRNEATALMPPPLWTSTPLEAGC